MADHITLQFVGLREAALAIEKWGADIEAKAREALRDEVNATVQEMKAAAPMGKTGNLAKGIVGKVETVGVSAVIRNRAPHSHLIEWGTKAGETKTHVVKFPDGSYRKVSKRGATPPRHIFVPKAIEARKRFAERVKKVLQQPMPDVGPGVPEVTE